MTQEELSKLDVSWKPHLHLMYESPTAADIPHYNEGDAIAVVENRYSPDRGPYVVIKDIYILREYRWLLIDDGNADEMRNCRFIIDGCYPNLTQTCSVRPHGIEMMQN